MDVPVEVHGHVDGLPHHEPVVPVQIRIESLVVFSVRAADLGFHAGHVGQVFAEEFEFVHEVLFRGDELSARIKVFFIGPKRDPHVVPLLVVLEIPAVGGAVPVVEGVFPAVAVVGKKHAFQSLSQIGGHSLGGPGVVLIGFSHESCLGELFFHLFENGVGKEPVPGGNDPLFPFFGGILGQTLFTFAPLGAVVVAELQGHGLNGLFHDMGGIGRHDPDDVRIGGTGLGLEPAVIGEDPFALDYGEIFRVFPEHLFRVLLDLRLRPETFLVHQKRTEAVAAHLGDDPPLEHPLPLGPGRIEHAGKGVEAHPLSQSPVPGIPYAAVPAHADFGNIPELEIRVFDDPRYGHGNVGLDRKILSVFAGKKPQDPGKLFQHGVGAVNGPYGRFALDEKSFFVRGNLETLCLHLWIIGEPDIDGVFPLRGGRADSGAFPAGNFGEEFGKFVRGVFFHHGGIFLKHDGGDGLAVLHEKELSAPEEGGNTQKQYDGQDFHGKVLCFSFMTRCSNTGTIAFLSFLCKRGTGRWREKNGEKASGERKAH